jgi:hypothetical protein
MSIDDIMIPCGITLSHHMELEQQDQELSNTSMDLEQQDQELSNTTGIASSLSSQESRFELEFQNPSINPVEQCQNNDRKVTY